MDGVPVRFGNRASVKVTYVKGNRKVPPGNTLRVLLREFKRQVLLQRTWRGRVLMVVAVIVALAVLPLMIIAAYVSSLPGIRNVVATVSDRQRISWPGRRWRLVSYLMRGAGVLLVVGFVVLTVDSAIEHQWVLIVSNAWCVWLSARSATTPTRGVRWRTWRTLREIRRTSWTGYR